MTGFSEVLVTASVDLSAGDKTANKDNVNVYALSRCQRGKPKLHWASLPEENLGRHSDVERKCEEPPQTSAAYFEDFALLAFRKPRHLEPPEPPMF